MKGQVGTVQWPLEQRQIGEINSSVMIIFSVIMTAYFVNWFQVQSGLASTIFSVQKLLY